MLTVNGEPVPDSLLREEAAALRPKYYEVMPAGDPVELEMQLREWSRENVIERVLLTQEAARRSVSVEELLATLHGAVPKPKNKDVAELYRKHKDSFWVPELVHAAHIVRNVDEGHPEAEARKSIDAAEADLQSGTPFAIAADRHSDCAGNGGDLGWFPKGHMVPEFEEVIFAMAPGQTSPVFRSTFGFHIAHCLARKPEGTPGLPDVREEIEMRLHRERQQHEVEKYVDSLRARAEISL
ncbi:MAG: peptidyl-prolyl cis-trans isomerase [Acidobacteriota bacterium]|nr:peptidyl-prolyl cis-trans isomerase [Acidobacteriota bacterium]